MSFSFLPACVNATCSNAREQKRAEQLRGAAVGGWKWGMETPLQPLSLQSISFNTHGHVPTPHTTVQVYLAFAGTSAQRITFCGRGSTGEESSSFVTGAHMLPTTWCLYLSECV